VRHGEKSLCFKTTRNDFKDFVDVYFDESKPIVYNEDRELLKQLSSDERWRVDTDINFGYDNSDSTLTPRACDTTNGGNVITTNLPR